MADDNADSADSLSTMLELLGHNVETAHDGMEAVEVAKTFLPEIVFLDLGMPRMNGYDAARLIRRLPECNGVVLVALTGGGQEEDKRSLTRGGIRLPHCETQSTSRLWKNCWLNPGLVLV